MKHILKQCSLTSALLCACHHECSRPGARAGSTRLPIPEPDYPRSTVLDAREATAPPRFEIKASAGAPNVLIVLVDDMGFGMPSAFGGPLRMPTAERLANEGLRYNQSHTTALCSPRGRRCSAAATTT